jgi:hypothetical protein
MYRLIIDGNSKSANSTFEELSDALWWYNYALQNSATSAALWCDQVLIKYFIKEQE